MDTTMLDISYAVPHNLQHHGVKIVVPSKSNPSNGSLNDGSPCLVGTTCSLGVSLCIGITIRGEGGHMRLVRLLFINRTSWHAGMRRGRRFIA